MSIFKKTAWPDSAAAGGSFFKFANKLAEYFFNKYSANLLCQYLKKQRARGV
jgi:hypothetical protein